MQTLRLQLAAILRRLDDDPAESALIFAALGLALQLGYLAGIAQDGARIEAFLALPVGLITFALPVAAALPGVHLPALQHARIACWCAAQEAMQ